ncbi:diversity-generating retroelement protein bAvd family protein [Sporosarcina sp. P12(2017)]|nr:diversity-generating retroelement protein bAvd family protein [Sporosarcina sp. P10]PIC62438.1 diversity-generating retroelement protein bAvd family protein [Sporosarcina sp. P12(2017)]
MSVQSMHVYRRTEELLYKMYPCVISFLKSEKFSLAQPIKQKFFDLLKYISLGNSVKSKQKIYLQEADGYLQVLKVLTKLSK